MRSRPQPKGFTLLEVMIVITIMGILLMMAVSTYRNQVASSRVYGALNGVNNDLGVLRVRAVAAGVPGGLCIRGDSFAGGGPGNPKPHVLTTFLKAQAAKVVDATTAIYDDANDKLVESRLLASDEADLVDMAGLNSAKTITIMYDALGVVSVFEADHCGDTLADTPIVKALPFLMTLAMKNNTYRQATLTIGIDGLITVQ